MFVPAGPAAAGGATVGAAAIGVPFSGTGGIAVNGENADVSASAATADVVADAGASDTEGASETDAAVVPAGVSADDPVGAAACTAAAGVPAGTSAEGTAAAGTTVGVIGPSGAAAAAGAEPPASPAVAAGAEAAEATDAALLATGWAVVSSWPLAVLSLTMPWMTCSGEALAASVSRYCSAPPLISWTNWVWKASAASLSA